MQISLTNVGKRFNREWIFRHLDYQFEHGNSYAITGPNGSGKSTLLQVIAGSLTFNEGTIDIVNNPQTITTANLYKCVSIAAPYLDLVEEMNGMEILAFHSKFKTLYSSLSYTEMLSAVGLGNAIHKQVRYYSSGMKQRLKLALAFFSDTSVLLLDEPTTNLDPDGISLYHWLVDNYTKNKLVIVCSNDQQEYRFCDKVIGIGDYKS